MGDQKVTKEDLVLLWSALEERVETLEKQVAALTPGATADVLKKAADVVTSGAKAWTAVKQARGSTERGPLVTEDTEVDRAFSEFAATWKSKGTGCSCVRCAVCVFMFGNVLAYHKLSMTTYEPEPGVPENRHDLSVSELRGTLTVTGRPPFEFRFMVRDLRPAGGEWDLQLLIGDGGAREEVKIDSPIGRHRFREKVCAVVNDATR